MIGYHVGIITQKSYYYNIFVDLMVLSDHNKAVKGSNEGQT